MKRQIRKNEKEKDAAQANNLEKNIEVKKEEESKVEEGPHH